MDSMHYEALRRMFIAKRLQPSIPEHAVFIAGELAKLKILEPHDYETFKEFYDRKPEIAVPPAVEAPVLDHVVADRVEAKEEFVKEPEVVEVKEKPKKPKKIK